MKVVDGQWDKLSLGQRIRSLELKGYVVMPDLLSPEMLDRLIAELVALPTTGTTYSERQQYVHGVQWMDCPSAVELIALPPMLAFLKEVFGDELICTGCTYARTEPGYPGMALHTDSQPYGSSIFGPQASAPLLVRVLYYLTGLTPDSAPLRVVPYSHLCLHTDANPYKRYKSNPEEEVVTCKAGSAVIINQKLFHAVAPNRSRVDRHVFAVAYRPAWAGPVAPVPDHAPQDVAKLPPRVKALFKSLNTRHVEYDIKNYSDDMAADAPKLGPSRWEV